MSRLVLSDAAPGERIASWFCPQIVRRGKTEDPGTDMSESRRAGGSLEEIQLPLAVHHGSPETGQTSVGILDRRENGPALAVHDLLGGDRRAACRRCSRSLAV